MRTSKTTQFSPTYIIFIFVVAVLVIQLAYLILVRPTPSNHSPVKKLNGYDFFIASAVRSYKPIKLHTLLAHRKDHTNSLTLIFLDQFGVKPAQNFLRECMRFHISNYVIFSLDNYTTCEKLDDSHCYFDQSYNFSTEHSRLSYKINITLYLVQQGYNIFSTHKDILLSDNPLLHFDRAVDLNVLSEYPTALAKAKADPQKCCKGDSQYYDAGFFFIQSTPNSISFLELYLRNYANDEDAIIGDAFNTAIVHSTITIRALSNIQFPNGFIAFWMAQNIEPVAIHSNWGNIDTKIYRARELSHWNLDDAERYSAPRQYITYTSEDDAITLQVEKDHLLFAYLLAKLLNRNLILPKFHCYIDRPPSCFLDSVFDTALTRELDVYENAFLQSANVPEEHLRRATLSLPDFDSPVKVGLMKELLFQLEGFTEVPLLVVEFPKMARDGKHYSLNMITDRRSRWDHELFVNQVEKSIQFSSEMLGNWTNFLPPYIKDAGADFVCLLTVPDETDFLIKKLAKIDKPLYIVSDEPTKPNPSNMQQLKSRLRNKVVFGYDELWNGHKLMEGHSVLAQLQMDTCARATEVIVNTFGPVWLVGGICSTRATMKKSPCNKLLRDPWEEEESPIKLIGSTDRQQSFKEKQEREKIAKTKHGVLAIYPERGPVEGGNMVTFMHSPENASHTFSNENYGGCKFGNSEVVGIAGVTKYMDAFYLVHCYAPAHAEGEVDPILLVNGEERLPFPGTIVYKCMSKDAMYALPDPYLSVCTVFKNQALYLREWISFHYMLGVKKFYLYDQGSEEDWKSTVADYIQKGIVEFYQWDLFLKPSTRMQTAALWHCIQNHHEISWMLLTDLDEFLVPVQYKKEKNFSVILHDFDNTDIAQIYVDRVNYGPSGHVDRPKGLVAENYYWREPKTVTPVKSIVRPKYITDTICGGVHTFKVQEGKRSTDITRAGRDEVCGRTDNQQLKRLRINHYWSKSVEDFNQKAAWDGNPYAVSPDELMQQWTNVIEDKIMEPLLFNLKKQIKQGV